MDAFFIVLIKGIIVILALFGAAAYMTFLERVIMARMQLRYGPNRVGPLGLLQPIADGLKLLFKESFQPNNISIFTYWLAPGISLFVALFIFVVIPIGGTVEIWGHKVALNIADLNAGVVFFLAIARLQYTELCYLDGPLTTAMPS